MPDVALKSDAGYLPPVTSSADNPADRQEFFSFFDHYIGQNAPAVAAAEDERLSYYKEALDQRFANALPESKGGAKKPFSLVTFLVPPGFRDHKPHDVYEPGDLKKIFKEITEQTRSIILSEVMICPAGLLQDKELSSRKEIYRGGMATEMLAADKDDKRSYHFGFYEIRQPATGNAAQWYKFDSDIALPVLALDDDMLAPVSAQQPHKMLRALQTVLTHCNHDMMHNMINTTTQGDISRPLEVGFKEELKRFMEHKTGRYASDDVLGLESSLLIGHARTWRHLENTPAGESMKQALSTYYDELDRIAAGFSADKNLPAATRHQVVDYFAMAVPFALARLLPLHDPLMDYALTRAEKAEPDLPAVLAQDTMIDLKAHNNKNDKAAKTAQYYRAAGTPLAADEKAPQNYAEVKKLQLTRMLPDITILLAPAPKGSPTYAAHARADEMDRDIANIILRTSKPPERY